MTAWGVSYPILIAAGGVVLIALSLQALLAAPQGQARAPDPETMPAACVAFPGLFPPIAVTVPLIFSVPFPGWEIKLAILALGGILILLNLLFMLRTKAIIRTLGPVPLQLVGAIFGVLQLALGLEFISDAARML